MVQFNSLSTVRRRSINFYLCNIALANWRQFTKSCRRRQLKYITRIPVMIRFVDPLLPADAMAAALLGRDHVDVEKRYLEPMTAIQDFDWKLPDEIEYSYLALHNLFRRYALADLSISEWTIASQALSSGSTHDMERVGCLFNQALEHAMAQPER